MDKGMILVTAAGGRTGRQVVRALRNQGASIRALVRKPQPALKDLGVTEECVGDLLDMTALRRACEGVSVVIHTGPASGDESVMGKWMIEAARAAGVGHFVYHSVSHPQIEWLPQHRQKLLVENHLIDSGLPFTILQPMHYFQNIDVKRAVQAGVYASAYSPGIALSGVDLEDLAHASALIAGDARHHYATYEICGSDYFNTSQIAEILSSRSGKAIRNQQISVADFVAQRAGSERGYFADLFTRLMIYYNRYGIRGNPNVLTWLLGRPPTTFVQYVDRMLAA